MSAYFTDLQNYGSDSIHRAFRDSVAGDFTLQIFRFQNIGISAFLYYTCYFRGGMEGKLNMSLASPVTWKSSIKVLSLLKSRFKKKSEKCKISQNKVF